MTDAFLGVCIYGENTINIYDRTTATAYFWIHDAGMLPDWIVAAPLRTIFNWFLSEHHIHLMHGAVIGTTAGALLLTAKGGSGKSTTALTSVLAGMNYLSDDYVGVGLSERITAHSLYNSAKITADALYRFPELETQFKAPQTAGEKSIVFLSSIFPEQIKSYSPLRAIMIPRISKAHDQDTVTRITPATKIQALLAILPTTLFQLPLAGLDQVPQLRTIIDRTPCYFLELGSDISTIPAILKAHLND